MSKKQKTNKTDPVSEFSRRFQPHLEEFKAAIAENFKPVEEYEAKVRKVNPWAADPELHHHRACGKYGLDDPRRPGSLDGFRKGRQQYSATSQRLNRQGAGKSFGPAMKALQKGREEAEAIRDEIAAAEEAFCTEMGLQCDSRYANAVWDRLLRPIESIEERLRLRHDLAALNRHDIEQVLQVGKASAGSRDRNSYPGRTDSPEQASKKADIIASHKSLNEQTNAGLETNPANIEVSENPGDLED